MTSVAMDRLNLRDSLNSSFEQLDSYGVGSIKIIGELADTPVYISGLDLEITFRVVNQPTEMIILGLDILKSTSCLIDLVANQVYFGGFHGTRVDCVTEEELAEEEQEIDLRQEGDFMWTK